MALAATPLRVLRQRAQDRTLPLPCACQVCEEWTAGPYCTLCNVTDGSRFYKESRCLPCVEGLLADLLWKVALIAAGVIGIIIFLNRCKCWEKTKWLQRLFLKGVVMYGQLDMRAKFKQYATHASNPRPADGPRQVCHLNTCVGLALAGSSPSTRSPPRSSRSTCSPCRPRCRPCWSSSTWPSQSTWRASACRWAASPSPPSTTSSSS